MTEKIVTRIEVRKGRSGSWYWRLIARNGEILGHSESYSSLSKAKKTANQVARQLGI